MRLSIFTTAAVALLSVISVGCSSSNSGASPSGGGADGGVTAAPGSALTCSAIIDCGSKCADNDEACANACVAKGSPVARDAVNAIVTCGTDNACQDSACYETKCPKQLETCIASGAAPGAPISGAAPTGNVPADLVGRWHSYDDFYEFMADGTVARLTSGKVGGCKTSRLEKGTAVAQGSSLTVYFTSSVYTVCDKPGSSAYTPNSVGFTFTVGPSNVGIKLVLTETNCRYTDPAAASQYCATAYDKE